MEQKRNTAKPFNKRGYLFAILALFIGLGFLLPLQFQAVNAQSYSGSDVVWAMNEIRAAYGLEAYVIRDDLMQLAQAHAEYMAENQVLTHVRADGSQPNVTSENISLGPIQIAINTWMDDQPHKDTLLAWSQGWVGAGVALSDNGYVYISYDMIRMDGAVYEQRYEPYPPEATTDSNAPTLAPGEPTPTAASSGINEYVNGVTVSTPDVDGYLYHEVLNGQTVWAIAEAYDSSSEIIIGLNNLDADNPTIWVGQKLLVKVVETPLPVTVTPEATEVIRTETPIPTLTSIPTATAQATQVIAASTPTTLPQDIVDTTGPKLSSIGMIVILTGVVAVVSLTLVQSGKKTD